METDRPERRATAREMRREIKDIVKRLVDRFGEEFVVANLEHGMYHLNGDQPPTTLNEAVDAMRNFEMMITEPDVQNALLGRSSETSS